MNFNIMYKNILKSVSFEIKKKSNEIDYFKKQITLFNNGDDSFEILNKEYKKIIDFYLYLKKYKGGKG